MVECEAFFPTELCAFSCNDDIMPNSDDSKWHRTKADFVCTREWFFSPLMKIGSFFSFISVLFLFYEFFFCNSRCALQLGRGCRQMHSWNLRANEVKHGSHLSTRKNNKIKIKIKRKIAKEKNVIFFLVRLLLVFPVASVQSIDISRIHRLFDGFSNATTQNGLRKLMKRQRKPNASDKNRATDANRKRKG